METLSEEAKEKYRAMCEADFLRRRDSPRAWYSSAEQLILGAEVLYERHLQKWNEVNAADMKDGVDYPDVPELFMLPTIYLLFGFGLENLFKARWVYQQQGKLDDDAWRIFFRNTSNGHSLLEIAKLTGFELTTHEERLLYRLEILLRSTTRYPTDKKVASHLPDFDGSKMDMMHHFSSSEIDQIRSLIKRLPEQYLPTPPTV